MSLEVEQGEVVGIIGRNGAGKSTLLKVLSRITYPTSGRVEVSGRVGSLLEVGTGFHDELTGRENIYLNGSILGMKKRETDAVLDRIIEFADVTEFLDTPIKRYSSGMRMRLGFAVAAHLTTDVLFVDEVLAVGDVGFQKKCLGAMRELGGGGRTIIFVSHNMAAVENLCKRTIWIADGQVKQEGDTREVIRAYLNSFDASDKQALDLAAVRERGGTGDVRFLKMEFLDERDGEEPVVYSGGPLNVRFHYECQRDMPNLYFGLRIFSNLGVLISDVHNWATNEGIPLAPKGRGTIDLEIDFLNLIPGTYYRGCGPRLLAHGTMCSISSQNLTSSRQTSTALAAVSSRVRVWFFSGAGGRFLGTPYPGPWRRSLRRRRRLLSRPTTAKARFWIARGEQAVLLSDESDMFVAQQLGKSMSIAKSWTLSALKSVLNSTRGGG